VRSSHARYLSGDFNVTTGLYIYSLLFVACSSPVVVREPLLYQIKKRIHVLK
jgi:hypothetical protein